MRKPAEETEGHKHRGEVTARVRTVNGNGKNPTNAEKRLDFG